MGGCCCCCSSSEVELNGSQPLYHYLRVSEQHEPPSSQRGTASVLPTGLLVDTNLGTSIPDTCRSPPAPVQCDANLGHPRTPPGNREYSGNKNDAAVQPTNTEPAERTDAGNSFEAKDLKGSVCKGQSEIELASTKEKSGELKKSGEPLVSAQEEEEDVCPTCLEEYDAENPKIITKCEHHFHLSCIFEWMERSNTCPVCDQEMIFSPAIDVG
ncbi:probable E3 ubiquitin-protein ligase RHB1A [Cornus florida]|uniref:probable E3 ubiquitin-protein ligase RHB1A n=1 Tax=Cornus florida TaxID=4283 RepID=UPI00289B3941|nr:probable E3 ubiquitin-protein ligase RHB1A [Cornus florida]XP_059641595.1 probable E3 ubiquitin-protein ligase RHB1A [Cornus florida]XP_059641596.1 probable E3 ubiquitin-protein ligase RHB1A [Cornus florida]